MGKKKILLTPEIAQELLKRNYEKNRTPRLSHVREIIADIKGGRRNPEISHYQLKEHRRQEQNNGKWVSVGMQYYPDCVDWQK